MSFKFVFILIFSFFQIGCSSLFYFPTKDGYYVNIEKLKHKPEIIQFKTADGLTLEGWYFPSQQKEVKGLILHFHGNAQNVSTHFMYLYDAPQLGYDYFVFDYRGFGRSEGKPNPQGVIKDGDAAILWAQQKMQQRSIKNLIFFCQSLGGAICLRTLAKNPVVTPQALVIDSSFSSYRSVARSVAQSTWLLWLLQPIAWLIVDNSEAPHDDLPFIKANKILIIHGDNDRVIAKKHGDRLFKRLPEPKEYWEIPNGQHTDFLFIKDGEYKVRFYAWLEKLL